MGFYSRVFSNHSHLKYTGSSSNDVLRMSYPTCPNKQTSGHLPRAEAATCKSGSAPFGLELQRGLHQDFITTSAWGLRWLKWSTIKVASVFSYLMQLSRFPFKVFGDISPSTVKKSHQGSIWWKEQKVPFVTDQESSESLMTVYLLLLKWNQFAFCNMHYPPKPLNHSMMAPNAGYRERHRENAVWSDVVHNYIINYINYY